MTIGRHDTSTDPQGDRRRAGRTHHRPEGCQARGRRGAAQSLAPPAARPRAARRGDPQEHPDDRPHRLRQDRDQPAAGQAGRDPLHQDRGDQVHRGRLCRPRCRPDRARPGRGSHPAGKGTPPRRGARGREQGRDGTAADRAGRRQCQRSDARGVPPADRRQFDERYRSRDRSARGPQLADGYPRHARRGRDDRPVRHVRQGHGQEPAQAPQAEGARCMGPAGR